MDYARRNFLKGRLGASMHTPLRPPWAQPEPTFLETCSRCAACLDACPEHILVRGDGGFPEVDFSQGECTFCRACADVCRAGALDAPPAGTPWNYVARIGTACLGAQRVYCRSCGEICERSAIHFSLIPQGVPLPRVSSEDCSGCGACVSVCPTRAVEIVHG